MGDLSLKSIKRESFQAVLSALFESETVGRAEISKKTHPAF